jgi:Apea-like HEPN
MEEATLTTVVPLLDKKDGLLEEKNRGPLGNGFFIGGKSLVSSLAIFSDDYLRRELSDAAWSRIDCTEFYLGVSEKIPMGVSPEVVVDKCNERLDRFLLALNLNGKLWSFRPDVRMSWVEGDQPSNRQFFRVRHHSPISTFDPEPTVRDFLEAAILTVKIDAIYETSEGKYPGIKTAFAALRLGAYAFNTAMRFLQLAIALEALCSTSTTEVAHRVAITCAILTANTPEERRDIYRKAKRLYGLRSRIIHGSGQRTPIEMVQEMERLTCMLLREVIEDNILRNYKTRRLQEDFLLQLALERIIPGN